MDTLVTGNALTIIDVDTHLSEPHDLWTSRAPAKWKDRVPQVKIINGVQNWVLDGQVISSMRAHSAVLPDLSKTSGFQAISNVYDEVHPGSYDIRERVRFMDQTGVWAQILYPNLLGFGGGKVATTDAELKTLCVKLYNDAMAEYQEISNQRIYGMAVLPWWNVAESVAEVERCAKMGLRGVNTNPEPQQQGFPDLATDYWTPLFEVCSDLSMPINFHIGSSEDQRSWFGDAPWPSLKGDQKLAIGGATVSLQNARVISNLIMSGVAERHPKQKFVSVESGAGWIPFLLESLDYAALEMMPDTAKMYSMKPSEYFSRQFYACFWFENRFLQDTIRQVGEDNIMFETDFPHPTCLYPNAAEYVAKALHGMSPAVQHKITSGNASKLYNIPLGRS